MGRIKQVIKREEKWQGKIISNPRKGKYRS